MASSSGRGLPDGTGKLVIARKVPTQFCKVGQLVPQRVVYVSVADVAVPLAGTRLSNEQKEREYEEFVESDGGWHPGDVSGGE